MTETIDESVLVAMTDLPKWVRWRNRIYKIEKIGFHHHYYEGKTLYHVFSVVTNTSFMKLTLNTESLLWKLTEIENGI